jgi:protein-L-isoaspartate O-methyltransferase
MHKLAQTSRSGHKRCLSEFENKDDEIIFEDATRNLPRWLEQNFKESGQMIKIFRNDNQAHLKIFVFQYLEMCYGSTRSRYS